MILRTMLLATLIATGPALAQEWRFVDGAGNTITLDNPPQRIVAFSSSAAGLMQFGIKPVAIFADGTGSEKSFGDLDREGIEYIETPWNELPAETLLALDPDVIITEYFSHSQSYSGGEEMHPDKEFGRVAPILGIEQGASALKVIEDYSELAKALGADIDTPDIAQQRKRFDEAQAAFAAAAAAKPELTVMAVNPGDDLIRVAVPAGAGELQDLISWGLDIVDPQADAGAYWGEISWENADTYPADVLLIDDRFDYDAGYKRIESNPGVRLLPAFGAGQVGHWPAWWIRTYASYAEELEKLTALLDRSEDVTD